MNNNPNWGLILGVISLLCTAITGGVVFGDLKGRVRQNSDDIARMQGDNSKNAAALAQIQETTTIIKTKLEILLPTATVKESRR